MARGLLEAHLCCDFKPPGDHPGFMVFFGL